MGPDEVCCFCFSILLFLIKPQKYFFCDMLKRGKLSTSVNSSLYKIWTALSFLRSHQIDNISMHNLDSFNAS